MHNQFGKRDMGMLLGMNVVGNEFKEVIGIEGLTERTEIKSLGSILSFLMNVNYMRVRERYFCEHWL